MAFDDPIEIDGIEIDWCMDWVYELNDAMW